MKNRESKATGKKSILKSSLGLKLALILGIIVLLSLVTVTFLNSYFISQDVQITAEENNLTANTRAASTVNDKLSTIRSNVFQLMDLTNVMAGGGTSTLARQAQSFFFERNQDIASIHILEAQTDFHANARNVNILNQRFFSANEIEPEADDQFLVACAAEIERSCNGETIALNASPFFKIPVMALLFPYKENGLDQTCLIVFGIETIADILGSNSINTTFMVNDNDELLSHPQTERILYGESMQNYPLVKAYRETNQNNTNTLQIPFDEIDENGKKSKFYGAYKKLDFADIVIFTTVPLGDVLEGVNKTWRYNIILTVVVFCLSTIVVMLYSRYGISRPIKRLTRVATEIQQGYFEKNSIGELDLERQDEIGVLNNSTVAELGFLNTFAKFTNQGVAKAIARSELDFEPHLKDLTIFFSDIRGFTAISDGFKNKFGNDSPRQIISFLNDYMSRMVECITLSGGNVDKFEGDAIMALWGIMRDDSIEYEKLPPDDPRRAQQEALHKQHVKEDALSAVKGSLAMRYALMKYNKDAEEFTRAHAGDANAEYKPYIKIGRGLNTGRATAGILGSKDKMEYTAIGDAVNFASRTESSNKPCGTDMLITEDTYNILKDDYIKCEANNFTIKPENAENEIIVERIPVEFDVKGKGAQHFYGVVNMPQFDIEKFFKQGNSDFVLDADCAKALGPTGPRKLNDVRILLGIDIPDFEKVNLNEEENKIQIKQG